MKALDFIQLFAKNIRICQFTLSSSQVIMAIVRGYRRHSTITEHTDLHPNTVTNILKDLIDQNYIYRVGDQRPYVYRPTPLGINLAAKLCHPFMLPHEE